MITIENECNYAFQNISDHLAESGEENAIICMSDPIENFNEFTIIEVLQEGSSFSEPPEEGEVWYTYQETSSSEEADYKIILEDGCMYLKKVQYNLYEDYIICKVCNSLTHVEHSSDGVCWDCMDE